MNAPSPKVTRARSFPAVWLVPLVALLVGGWLIFRETRNHGPEITLHFASGAGVEPGKTDLVHQGVIVGTVQDMALDQDLGGVTLKLRLTKGAEDFARTGAQFWIVRPQVSFSGVRGLETLIAGVQIAGRPGRGEPAKEFSGLDRQPVPEESGAGRAFILRSDKLGSLSTGSPVYYREIKVGAVETSRLADDASEVLIRIRVYTPYIDLVRENSRFWNAGGVDFKVSVFGAELKSTSLQSIFTGGVEFATPDENGLAPTAAADARFQLHEGPEKAWLKWRPRIPIQPMDSEPTPRSARSATMPVPVKTGAN
jgi:paraquat-inducible protein B